MRLIECPSPTPVPSTSQLDGAKLCNERLGPFKVRTHQSMTHVKVGVRLTFHLVSLRLESRWPCCSQAL
eukprot:1053897-Amphidinium_carterae.1